MKYIFALTALVCFLLILCPTVPAADTCHIVMEGETTTNYYESIADAVWSIGSGTGVITMIANDVITATNLAQRVDVDGHVTVVSDGGDYTIMRGVGPDQFSMLYVGRINLNTNAVLTLGAPGMTGTLTFDGGSFTNRGASIIQSYRGTFNMYGGIILQNNITEYGGGGVYNEGIFNMYGGLITSNLAFGAGGGVQNAGYYGEAAVFNMYGGAILYNKSLNGTYEWGGYGGGVANEGAATFNMFGGIIDGNEAEFAGGGVNNTRESQSGTETATFNMTGGTISGNTVTDEAGQGSGVYNDDVMTMESDAGISEDNDVYLDDTVIIVTGELTGSGVAATITSSGSGSGTPVIMVSSGAGVTLDDVIAAFVLESQDDEVLIVDSESGAIVTATAFEAWLLQRNLDPEDPDFAPDADMDGDGMTTSDEFVADTNPTNSLSALRVAGSSVSLDQVLTFPASTGRFYSLYRRLDLENGDWQAVVTGVQGTNTTMSMADTNEYETIYYRITAQRQP